jgi:hypothetical protein
MDKSQIAANVAVLKLLTNHSVITVSIAITPPALSLAAP